MQKVQSGNEWEEVTHFNNEFTSNEINHCVLKSYEETVKSRSIVVPVLEKDTAKEITKKNLLLKGELIAFAGEIAAFTEGSYTVFSSQKGSR